MSSWVWSEVRVVCSWDTCWLFPASDDDPPAGAVVDVVAWVDPVEAALGDADVEVWLASALARVAWAEASVAWADTTLALRVDRSSVARV